MAAMGAAVGPAAVAAAILRTAAVPAAAPGTDADTAHGSCWVVAGPVAAATAGPATAGAAVGAGAAAVAGAGAALVGAAAAGAVALAAALATGAAAAAARVAAAVAGPAAGAVVGVAEAEAGPAVAEGVPAYAATGAGTEGGHRTRQLLGLEVARVVAGTVAAAAAARVRVGGDGGDVVCGRKCSGQGRCAAVTAVGPAAETGMWTGQAPRQAVPP